MPAFLLSPLFRYAALALAISAMIAGIWFHGRSSGVNSMVPRVEEANSRAESYAQTAKNYKMAVQAQNQAVASMEKKHGEQVALLNERLTAANVEGRKFRDAAEKRATNILTMPLPENECEALFTLIDSARGMR